MVLRRNGFTLIELLVVVFIIGILAAIVMPQYTKTLENSKADDALTMVQMIATTNRMYGLDNGQIYVSGQLTDACLTAACPLNPNNNVCNLMACGYLGKQQFDRKSYIFYAADGAVTAADPCGLGAPASSYVACARRRSGAAPGTNASPYVNWGYTINRNGQVSAWPSSNGPPPPQS